MSALRTRPFSGIGRTAVGCFVVLIPEFVHHFLFSFHFLCMVIRFVIVRSFIRLSLLLSSLAFHLFVSSRSTGPFPPGASAAEAQQQAQLLLDYQRSSSNWTTPSFRIDQYRPNPLYPNITITLLLPRFLLPRSRRLGCPPC
jgi:hypothetical protein